jgi:hypothetical protein
MKKLLYVAILAFGVVVMMAPPVMAQDEKPFTLHGEVRFRGEYDDNASDFDDDLDDGALFWPYRVRIAAEGHFAKNITAWLEFQSAGVAGDDATGFAPVRTGLGFTEMYQGNITLGQLWSKNFSLRIGRQEMVAGTELLLGDLDFYAGLSHDGLVGNWKFDKWNLMTWYTRPLEGSVSGFFGGGFLPPDQNPVSSCAGGCDTQHFLGAYANWTVAKNQGIDVYLMSLADRDTGGNFQTIGGRYSRDVAGKNGLFWNLEAAIQTGQTESEFISGADLDAGGRVIEGWIGWNFKAGKHNHRVYARYTQASGDDDPLDNSDDSFQSLFGDFHNRLGHGDFFQVSGDSTQLGGVAGLGINAMAAGWNGHFGDRSELGAELWKFTTDVEDPVTTEDALGSELDFWYNYNYSKNLTFSASLSRFSPDDELTGTGPGALDDTVSRLYGNARFRF